MSRISYQYALAPTIITSEVATKFETSDFGNKQERFWQDS